MSAPLPPKSARRSYFGIGSCCLFAIALGCVLTWIASNWNAQYKMAGLDGIVVLPFALLLNFIGSVMGYAGMCRPAENPYSRIGLVLNLVPLFWVATCLVASVVVQMGLGR